MRSRLAAALVTTAVFVSLLTGCGGDAPAAATARATVGTDFYNEADPPPPEGTITPAPGSWDHVHAPKNYRAVLVSMGADPQTTTLVKAVDEWARAEGVRLQHIVVTGHDEIIAKVTAAIDLKTDLVVSAGNGLVDALATITAAHLQQNFLVVGAELAEPTHNVTAADWTGASFRGEGLGAASAYDPKSFTPERAARAIRAGAAAVLSNHTGIVVGLD
ncbi:hypothetical protein ACXJJ3_37815 [Kribbella sp. WER1]